MLNSTGCFYFFVFLNEVGVLWTPFHLQSKKIESNRIGDQQSQHFRCHRNDDFLLTASKFVAITHHVDEIIRRRLP